MKNFTLIRIKEFCKRIIINNLSLILPMQCRLLVYKSMGFKIGKKVRINSNVFFSTSNIEIGDNSFMNRFCQVHDGLMCGHLKIGKNVFISFNVTFVLVSHEIGTSIQRAGKRVSGDITIGDGTWIGANVTILPNVTIGNGCIIASGSLVNKNCKDNCLYAGVPAKLIREL